MPKKICKKCKFVNKDDALKCFSCGSQSFTNTFKGRICIINPEKSLIAKKVGITVAGEYAVKVR